MLDAPAFFPILPLMDRSLEISIQGRHNFYDCLYVALTEREDCELLTADEKLIRNLQPSLPFIRPLASMS
jgi:predicted nucleic acid-binding protein